MNEHTFHPVIARRKGTCNLRHLESNAPCRISTNDRGRLTASARFATEDVFRFIAWSTTPFTNLQLFTIAWLQNYYLKQISKIPSSTASTNQYHSKVHPNRMRNSSTLQEGVNMEACLMIAVAYSIWSNSLDKAASCEIPALSTWIMSKIRSNFLNFVQ